jgi:membrane-bound lytic murein transglycosylase D
MLMESYENYQFLRSRIAPIYEEAGLPEALLFAIIATETGGKVHSYSRAGAAGPLQFMRLTGRRYGLKVVDDFDMRLDPVAATEASVGYLNDQFKALNDSLEKALAAYNGGENRIRRLHRRYKGASLWDNRIYYRLPRETREYVPRVLAAAWLFLNPEDYNLDWPSLETETTQLIVQKDISLGELTVCIGQVENRNGWFRTLRNLNPRLNPGERVKAGERIEIPAILVPFYESRCLDGELLERAQLLHEANYPYGEMIAYVVQPGDTLGRIASRFRCASVRDLAAINNIRPPRYVIRVGQRLRIPNCD